ncbi:DUF2225 domain-containing protein [Desulfonatronovibrio magnus]|uniref:DUF2225 domain-containing protein n=1 Tax=Desulfonatronovibrio magnus TaxID=698827 RepID=UPI000696C913|nr:DUF2225 domain-containing protein [Desulfonatronovibrio magnus]
MNLAHLQQIGSPRNYQEDDIIFHQGEPGDEMHVLLSGKVAVYINSVHGFPIEVAAIEPGNVFGEMSVLEDEPRSATIIASEDTVTIALNKKNFRHFIRNQPELTYKLLKVLSGRIRTSNEQLAQNWDCSKDDLEARSDGSSLKADQDKEKQSGRDSCSSEFSKSPPPKGLFPPAHKTYSKNIATDDKNFTFKKAIYCPVCDHQFDVKMLKLSKLRLISTDKDFRQRFADFEPIYYSVWMCPVCSYANFHSNFQSISRKNINLLKENTNNRKSMVNIHLIDPNDINYVFVQYYMADKCMNEIGNCDIHKAKLWIRLKWLYQDLEDEEMYRYSLSRSIELYYNAMYNARPSLNPEQEQQVGLLLGELYMENKQYQDARKHFWNASRIREGKEVMRKQASDRLWDLKSMESEQSGSETRRSSKSSDSETIYLKA